MLCQCGKARNGPYSTDQCRYCWKWLNDEVFRNDVIAKGLKVGGPKPGLEVTPELLAKAQETFASAPPPVDRVIVAPPERKRRIEIPCFHFDPEPTEPPGQRTGVDGKPCGCSAQWLYGCDVYGSCVRSEKNARMGVACCETCSEYTVEAPMNLTRCLQATPELSAVQMVELINNANPGPWPGGWDKWKNTQEAHRLIVNALIPNLPAAPPEGRYKGRGIIIAGGAKPAPNKPWGYLPCVWVLVNKLRLIGCNLPVQLWHLGPAEMDPYVSRLLRQYDVEVIDGEAVAAKLDKSPRILCGWELKAFAAIHCPFEEVLFLDADNAPIAQEPSFLFDTPEYQRHGAAFWPDYDHWRLKPDVWKIFGMEPRDEPALETGQWMVNKSRCWRELLLAHWYNDHSDYVFKHVYGDKETFHLAWRRLGSEYAIPNKAPGWVHHTIVQHDFNGRAILLHRVQDKWRLDGANKKVGLPDEDIHFELAATLKSVWPGRLWKNYVPNETDRFAKEGLIGSRWDYRRIDLDRRVLVLGANGVLIEGAMERENTWELFADEFGITLVLFGVDGKVTCILKGTKTEDRWIFKGRWLEYERCYVEMSPYDGGELPSPGFAVSPELAEIPKEIPLAPTPPINPLPTVKAFTGNAFALAGMASSFVDVARRYGYRGAAVEEYLKEVAKEVFRRGTKA